MYWIETRKVNLSLDESQQKEIFNIWMNPVYTSDSYKNKVIERFKSHFVKTCCESTKHMLEEIKFVYEEKKKGIKIISFSGRLGNEDELFSRVAHIIKPGSFVTFKGEDGDIFGWFFKGEIIHYSSYAELKKLLEPFELKKSLDKELSTKEITTKIRIKV
jgi:hypothetical protein